MKRFIRIINFLRKLKNLSFSERKSIVSPKGAEVFGITELVMMILPHMPALDLLVLQRVNSTWSDIINTSKSIQEKLFMNQGEEQSGASELRWNPFLLKYGEQIVLYNFNRDQRSQRSYHPCIRIRRDHLQGFDCPSASWKKMFVLYPKTVLFSAFVLHSSGHGTVRTSITDIKAVDMKFLMRLSRRYYYHGGRSKGDWIIIEPRGL